ncbi:hypothetical protein LEP1GSC123_2324 [Leptospira borgpetersenii str. 200701203]|uniref:Uncharacterized protein n=1 Tax=Leptospira borgpetersenii str. 200701203 TaxID=1193007 RepID=M3FEF1_LEPBO|nr:hypothetical protein LEP1GSC123_2324 [Leptospira borgpetersenii str. 200701203]
MQRLDSPKLLYSASQNPRASLGANGLQFFALSERSSWGPDRLLYRIYVKNLSQNCLLWKRHCRDTVLSPLNVGVPTDHGFLNIYGLSNRFYCSCTLVGVLTIPRFWDKF